MSLRGVTGSLCCSFTCSCRELLLWDNPEETTLRERPGLRQSIFTHFGHRGFRERLQETPREITQCRRTLPAVGQAVRQEQRCWSLRILQSTTKYRFLLPLRRSSPSLGVQTGRFGVHILQEKGTHSTSLQG